jgi:hypothetical protein
MLASFLVSAFVNSLDLSYIYIRLESWDDLCPKYNSLSSSQLGASNAYEQAANLTSLLLPD